MKNMKNRKLIRCLSLAFFISILIVTPLSWCYVQSNTVIQAGKENKDNNENNSNFPTQLIHKKILIIVAGLAGTGKSTYTAALNNAITNSMCIEKDTISTEFMLQGENTSSERYTKEVKHQVYQAMLKLADLNLKQSQNKVVILDGYFGDKLSHPLLKNYLASKDFETKVIYFHCSGAKQKERLEARAKIDEKAALRDSDKLGEHFEAYRLKHITKHLAELSQVDHLIVDTEQDEDLEENVQKIIQYLESPNKSTVLISKGKFFRELLKGKVMKGMSGGFISKLHYLL